MTTGDGLGDSPPLVSVVVPVLHDAPGIRSCLEAVLAQTYPPDRYEIIVADNGSTDGTRAVVERLRAAAGSRLSLVIEDRIRTSYAARNQGIRVARGGILAFTDADCVPAATWLERGVRALRAEAADCVGGRIVVTYRGPQPNVYEYWDSAAHFNQERYVRAWHFGATANLFVHAHVMERCGLFCPALGSGGDREFGERVWKAGGRIAYAADAVVAHPARATLGAIYRKGLRVARAHRSLHRLGTAPRWECTARLVRSTWRCPVPRDWTGHLPLAGKVTVRLLHHLNAWLLATVCLSQGLRAWDPFWRRPRTARRSAALSADHGVAPGA